jgi:hypothetical protein
MSLAHIAFLLFIALSYWIISITTLPCTCHLYLLCQVSIQQIHWLHNRISTLISYKICEEPYLITEPTLSDHWTHLIWSLNLPYLITEPTLSDHWTYLIWSLNPPYLITEPTLSDHWTYLIWSLNLHFSILYIIFDTRTILYIFSIVCIYICLYLQASWNITQCYSDLLQAGWSGDRNTLGTRFSTPVQTGPGTHLASCTMGAGSFLGVKQRGRGSNHPPPSNVEFKERV